MHARRFRLHDREHVNVERFDGSDAVCTTDLDVAADDCVGGVTAGVCNRSLRKVDDILDSSNLADGLSLECSEQNARGFA